MLVVIIGFTSLVIVSNNWNDTQIIKNIEVNGNTYINNSSIKNLINKIVIGKKTHTIDLLKIEKIVNEYSYVEYSYITFKDNETIEVSIKERKPLAFVKTDNGNLKYIDKYGVLMDNIPINKFADLPIVYGYKFEFLPKVIGNNKNKVNDKNLNNSLKNRLKNNQMFVNKLSALLNGLYEHEFVYNIISEIEFNNKEQTFSFYTSDRNLKILFGRLDNIDSKCQKMIVFWKEWIIKNKTDNLKHLDLRWENKVVLL